MWRFKKPKYTIERPPLSSNFQLPSSEELLKLKVGDLAKIMIRHETDGVERMWVIITKQQDISQWTGVLDNDPYGEGMAKILKPGDEIVFHPLDIVDIYNENDNTKNKEYLKLKHSIELPK